ncbi:MAG: dienelactone hydrolase family protein [SAR324 cluster bacterium]
MKRTPSPDLTPVSDCDATAAWAARNGGDGRRMGITGWCRGGRTTWLYGSKNNSGLKAADAWYGALAGNRTEAMPKTSLDTIGELKPPVLGLYGGQDAGIPLAQVEELRAAAAGRPKAVELVVYPDAPHGCNADYRPTFRVRVPHGLQRSHRG